MFDYINYAREANYYTDFIIDHNFKNTTIVEKSFKNPQRDDPVVKEVFISTLIDNDYSGSNVVHVETSDHYYQLLVKLSILNESRTGIQELLLSQEELMLSVNKLCILVDLLMTHYSTDDFNLKDDIFKENHIFELFLGRNIGEISSNNGFLSCDNENTSIREMTHYYHFINHAYAYYTRNYDNIVSGNDDDFFSRLLISFFSLGFCNGQFSLNYMINPDSYANSNSGAIVERTIMDHNLKKSYDTGDYFTPFFNNLYYRSVMSESNFSTIMFTDRDLIDDLVDFDNEYFHDYDYSISAYKNPTEYNEYFYGAEPENINGLVTATIMKNYKIKPLRKHFNYINSEFNLRNVNGSVVHTFLETMRIGGLNQHYLGTPFKNIDDSTISFLYSQKMIDYLCHYNNDTIAELIISMSNDLGVICDNPDFIKKHNPYYSFRLLTPYLIHHANKYFEHNIDNNLIAHYMEFCKKKSDDSLNGALFSPISNVEKSAVSLLIIILPRLNNKEKMMRFLKIYEHYYNSNYYQRLDSDDHAKILGGIIDDDFLAENVLHKRITVDHAVNIMLPIG